MLKLQGKSSSFLSLLLKKKKKSTNGHLKGEYDTCQKNKKQKNKSKNKTIGNSVYSRCIDIYVACFVCEKDPWILWYHNVCKILFFTVSVVFLLKAFFSIYLDHPTLVELRDSLPCIDCIFINFISFFLMLTDLHFTSCMTAYL